MKNNKKKIIVKIGNKGAPTLIKEASKELETVKEIYDVSALSSMKLQGKGKDKKIILIYTLSKKGEEDDKNIHPKGRKREREGEQNKNPRRKRKPVIGTISQEKRS